MKVRAKSDGTPCPIWVHGEYITEAPVRPCDGAIRPKGHYIDKGGYPGANVYAIDITTLCKITEAIDRLSKAIYEKDVLLYETEEEIGYFIIEDQGQAVDIINGEIMQLQELQQENIKIIGNLIDTPDFIEGMRYHTDNELEIPYLPMLNVQITNLPYFVFKCTKCGNKTLGCQYKAHCTKCGGYLTAGYTTKVYRERKKVLA